MCSRIDETKTDNNPTIILIGGAWSAGKSSTAVRLACHLNIANVVHTDVLRSCLRASIKGEKAQCISLATYRTWRCEAQVLSCKSLAIGFLRQCQILLPSVRRCLQEAIEYGKDTVMEGLHLHPSLLQTIAQNISAIYVWLTYPDDVYEVKVSDRCCSTYRNRDVARYLEAGRAYQILMLNHLLMDAAQEHQVTTLDITKEDPLETLCKMLSKPAYRR